jgi:hypothetical protein
VLSEALVIPRLDYFADLISLDTKAIRDVVERRLAGLTPMSVDLHRHGSTLAVARRDLDPEENPVANPTPWIAGQTGNG